MKPTVIIYTVYANDYVRMQTISREEAEQHATGIHANEGIICEIEESEHTCVDHTLSKLN